MANMVIRAGGAPQAAGDYVACDQVTIIGDGTAQNPLRAASVVPPDQIERVTSVGGAVTVDPDVELSIVSSQSPPSAVTINLGAPTANIDGYQKTILISYAPVIDDDYYRLLAEVQAGLGIGWSFNGGGGAAVLIWDAVGGFWRASSIYAGVAISV